jgi:hypothetical protein
MPVFMIGYDLHEGEDYENLINAIKSLTTSWWHCLDSTWFIISNSDAQTIRETLKPHMRNPDVTNGDKLLVVRIATPANWACTGSFAESCKQWLLDNLGR